jgi:hypothetical protein
MATPKESSQQAARLALRLHRRTQNHLSTSYRESGGESSSPAQETPIQNPPTLRVPEIGNRLSWLDLPDDRWPSDYWRVGADLRPDLWPVLWTFLLEGGE